MKKIGVITWYKYNNYGTKLQAFALQKYLTNCNYKTELINYCVPEYHGKGSHRQGLYDIVGRILKKIVIITNYKNYKQKEDDLSNFINNTCTISNYVESNDDYVNLCNTYDYLLFGSDQIWNPNWFHPYYYANFNDIKTKRIAYAPSFGVHTIPTELLNDYKKALSRFDSISMREISGCNKVGKLLKKDIPFVLDPVFLLDRSEWKKYSNGIIKYNKPFILVYLLSDNYNHWKAIKKYAKQVKKDLVIIPVGGYSYFNSKNIVSNCGIGMFLNLFDSCDEVLTDSFHGTIFSIIFNKSVRTFERHNPNNSDSQNERLNNILDIVGLKNRIIPFNSKSINIIDDVNYEIINEVIDKKINESKEFIKRALDRSKK